MAREFINPDVSRSGLDRCLCWHGVSNLEALIPDHPQTNGMVERFNGRIGEVLATTRCIQRTASKRP